MLRSFDMTAILPVPAAVQSGLRAPHGSGKERRLRGDRRRLDSLLGAIDVAQESVGVGNNAALSDRLRATAGKSGLRLRQPAGVEDLVPVILGTPQRPSGHEIEQIHVSLPVAEHRDYRRRSRPA